MKAGVSRDSSGTRSERLRADTRPLSSHILLILVADIPFLKIGYVARNNSRSRLNVTRMGSGGCVRMGR